MSWTCVFDPSLDVPQVRAATPTQRVAPAPVIVVGPDAARVAAVARSLAHDEPHHVAADVVEGWCTLVVGMDLATPDLGPTALVTAHEWLLAVRRLALRLVPDGQSAVWSAPGPVWHLMYLRRFFPDATFVLAVEPGEDPEWDARLHEVRRDSDLLPGDAARARTEPMTPLVVSPQRTPSTGQRVVVLVGSGRSGTTWAHRLLCSSDLVVGTRLGETSVFRLLEPLWSALGGHQADERSVTAMRSFVDEVLVDALDPDGSRFVCEKTPAHSWHLQMIRHLLPDAHVVHVLRHGRSVALSLWALEDAFSDPASAGRAWRRAVEAIGRDAAGACRVLRYEDLCHDPVAAVQELFDWLGLPMTDADREAIHGRSAERVSPLPVTGTTPLERWVALDRTQRRALQREIGGELKRWGYSAHREPAYR